MKIYDLASPFLDLYVPSKDYYENYFNEHPHIYNYYFDRHCRNKEMKLENALITQPKMIEQMKWIARKFITLIPQITEKYENLFPVKFTKDAYVFVGLGGSNAYTYLSMDPQVAFCVEKFEPDEEGLSVIVAHEFGHATHHLFTTLNEIEAKDIEWSSPYTWLLQEGLATYLSSLVVDVNHDIYFAYKRDPEWLAFCEENTANIVTAFHQDLAKNTSEEIFKEWFSINGGQIFGYSRLGYYIAYHIVNYLVNSEGIENTMLYWGRPDFKERIIDLIRNII